MSRNRDSGSELAADAILGIVAIVAGALVAAAHLIPWVIGVCHRNWGSTAFGIAVIAWGAFTIFGTLLALIGAGFTALWIIVGSTAVCLLAFAVIDSPTVDSPQQAFDDLDSTLSDSWGDS